MAAPDTTSPYRSKAGLSATVAASLMGAFAAMPANAGHGGGNYHGGGGHGFFRWGWEPGFRIGIGPYAPIYYGPRYFVYPVAPIAPVVAPAPARWLHAGDRPTAPETTEVFETPPAREAGPASASTPHASRIHRCGTLPFVKVEKESGPTQIILASAPQAVFLPPPPAPPAAQPEQPVVVASDFGWGKHIVASTIGGLLAIGLVGIPLLMYLRREKKAAAPMQPPVEPSLGEVPTEAEGQVSTMGASAAVDRTADDPAFAKDRMEKVKTLFREYHEHDKDMIYSDDRFRPQKDGTFFVDTPYGSKLHFRPNSVAIHAADPSKPDQLGDNEIMAILEHLYTQDGDVGADGKCHLTLTGSNDFKARVIELVAARIKPEENPFIFDEPGAVPSVNSGPQRPGWATDEDPRRAGLVDGPGLFPPPVPQPT